MDTKRLEPFARSARTKLGAMVATRLDQVRHSSGAEKQESHRALEQLEREIQRSSRQEVIDRVAYIWFNRLCALRFLDANGYTAPAVVSPAGEGYTQPALLQAAKEGHIPGDIAHYADERRIMGLLDNSLPSPEPQQEAYRLLLKAACNHYHGIMPFIFEEINDYTELLMPRDLLSESSLLTQVRDVLTQNVCRDVEVIGWLYQFYISEKKEEVFAGLRQNKKVTPEHIPAATQLFTPHWIVRYLLENTLGRLWLLNHPESRLAEGMDYYIPPEEDEEAPLHVASPEELRVLDPACGSGHMLTYAFDLLYRIYEEQGYQPSRIPSLILEKNLYGLEIDERAGELAAFALFMKARGKDRRFFRRGAEPSIAVFEDIAFQPQDLERQAWFAQQGDRKGDLYHDLQLFNQGKHFGSLLRPRLSAEELLDILSRLDAGERDAQPGVEDSACCRKARKALTQALYLSRHYHVVVANPPYMGRKNMNKVLAEYLQNEYTAVKSDLFSAFVLRNTELALPGGQLGYMSPYVWMFISSYEKLRGFLVDRKTITSLIQLEYSGFEGATVPICTFTVENRNRPEFRGGYIRLADFRGADNQAPRALEAIRNQDCGWFYRAATADFKKIPGAPIAYWMSEIVINAFSKGVPIGEIAFPRKGNTTTDNARFLRFWPEVSSKRMAIYYSSAEQFNRSGRKWVPYNKGGGYRKWYGLNIFLVNWKNFGEEIKAIFNSVIANEKYFFSSGLTWSTVTSKKFSVRKFKQGYIFDNGGCCVFCKQEALTNLLSFMNSIVFVKIYSEINPTLNFQSGEVAKIPFIYIDHKLSNFIESAVSLSKSDWDAYETSWDFTDLPLLRRGFRGDTLEETYGNLRRHWRGMTDEMQRLEEENNRIFIQAYGLEDELTPDVPLEEITLTCNPHYRYSGSKSKAELEALLLKDTMKEFISYAVGCMFGRYSLDRPGLILANQGETVEDYLAQVPEPTFAPDEDNVIPILGEPWFADDIAERFKRFLAVTFGEERFERNLAFIEGALGKDVRKYFLKEFYNDHLRRYRKRPIYWLVSSPGGGFNALIYLHRYRPDTFSVVLNSYLREFVSKLESRQKQLERTETDPGSSKGERTRAVKEREANRSLLRELADFERRVLLPLAGRNIEIDLDDGVKTNYARFGEALKTVKGLNG